MVSGTVQLAGVGTDPLLVAKVIVVPAGMELPNLSRTVTVAVEGVFWVAPTTVQQEDNTMPVAGVPGVSPAGTGGALMGRGLPPSMREAAVIEAAEAASEVEKMIT
jgi:hypothetical protein